MKASDLLTRVQELQLLAKRISRYENPIGQFRALSYLKPSNWSKGCGWNQRKCASFHAIIVKPCLALSLFNILLLIFVTFLMCS